MIASDTIEVLLARSACYHALSVLLRHPPTRQRPAPRAGATPSLPAEGRPGRWGDHPDAQTAQWLERREHHRLPEVIAWLVGERGSEVLEPARRVVTLLDSISLEEWTRQYERIFGHSVQSMAPPYELEYGEEHSHRQPQELGDIAAFYQAFGLRAATAAHERVDHIVAECEFLQYLLYKQACALDEGQEEHAALCQTAARQFLADHLGRWGPAFALRLARASGKGALGAVAEMTLTWLMWDCAKMGVAAGPRDLPLRLPKERDEAGCAACASNQGGTTDGGC